MTVYIETERLYLRSWTQEDLLPYIALNQDKEVMQFLPKLYNPEETREFYHLIQEEFKTRGFSFFVIADKITNRFIGYTGFHHVQMDVISDDEAVEIGWRLHREFWGQGLATEAAKACLDYGFSVLKLKEVYSFTAKINHASEKIMQKLGMTFIKEFQYPDLPNEDSLSQQLLYRKRAE